MSYRNATPVIRVSDYARAKAFYSDVLGFSVINEAGDPVVGFGIFQAGSAQIFLHAWDGAGPAWDNWRAYFYVDDQNALIDRLRAQGGAFKGPSDTPYNMREVEVTDPDGNILCFGTDMLVADKTASQMTAAQTTSSETTVA
ncbi:MAG: VOC family protein [Pseudomonadota bacterium]